MEHVSIQHVFQTVYPFRTTLLEMLTASDVSAFCYSIRSELSSSEENRFLNPLRDMASLEPMMRKAINDGCYVALLGTDVNVLLTRIRQPHVYWHSDMHSRTMVLWPVIIHRSWLNVKTWDHVPAAYKFESANQFMWPGPDVSKSQMDARNPTIDHYRHMQMVWKKHEGIVANAITVFNKSWDEDMCISECVIRYRHKDVIEKALLTSYVAEGRHIARTSYIDMTTDPFNVINVSSRKVVYSEQDDSDTTCAINMQIAGINGHPSNTTESIEIYDK